jgi:hypothetical protein
MRLPISRSRAVVAVRAQSVVATPSLESFTNPTGEFVITENGWPSCGPDQLERNPVPGTNIVIPLQRGIPNRIMKAFAADYHAYIEPLNQADTGGWTATNSVATSNHLGGTAMDLRWNSHAFQKRGTFSPQQMATIRELLAWYEGMIYWGGDWNSPIDEMHWQMGYNTNNNQAKCNDFINRKIKADGFSTFRRGAAPADPNAFPLPLGYCFGPLDGPEYSISGDFETDLQSWKDGLGRWQAALGLPVTKHWDDATKNAATVLQKAKGWPSNPDFGYGGVFLGEWDAVIREGWRLPGAPPAPKKPVIVGPADDQLNMRWNCLGGKTLLEAVAEIRDHLLNTSDKDKTGVVVK